MRLDQKVALVTGAARGLGRACAVALAAEGADVVLADVAGDVPGVPYPLGTASQLEHTARLCREHGVSVLVQQVDVRDRVRVDEVVAAAVERFGHLDVLINNAGIAAPSGRPVHEVTEADWSLMLDINLNGAWRMLSAVAPVMVAQRAGSIVNISSTAGLVGYRNFAGYVTAKHGLIGLTKAAALDLAPLKVRVNAVCPGSVRDSDWVEGRMLAAIADSLGIDAAEHEQIFAAEQPTNALVEPEDVAATTVWLASDESRQVTGSVVTVDGGFSTR
ncbi:SDR family oxidoreductase [Kribbella antibiotica]|uniref:SDR family oxidoreductase n=1 Tax=Kribbella antibiotica TaxID=190195 RepID=A0A4R4ZQP5_9ACTN|nr:SDR family oxidoreductase [Kribbella antibiotica]TDD61281.1 SDR family oxidoreductase [Kribbella antibiotica]